VFISPNSASLQVGQSMQFTANVSGPNKSVTWLVNGAAGGNPTVGTISSTGVYTAPAAVPSGGVTVTAQSVAQTSATASAAVTINPAPTRISVYVLVIPPNVARLDGEWTIFSAAVAGTTNNSVTWLVNGAAGGNPTAGTISSTGMYTAPAA